VVISTNSLLLGFKLRFFFV